MMKSMTSGNSWRDKQKTGGFERTDQQVFDSAFKTLASLLPQLMAPIVDEAHGRAHSVAEKTTRGPGDVHLGGGRFVSADAVFSVRDRIYHIECESKNDPTMSLRMFEYDTAIALESARLAQPPYVVRLPESCVVYLSPMRVRPKELNVLIGFPASMDAVYTTKALHVCDCTLRQVGTDLIALVPFYLLRHRNRLDTIDRNPLLKSQFLAECAELNRALRASTCGEGGDRMYNVITTVTRKVCRHLLRNHAELLGKVGEAMGGEVWDLDWEEEQLKRARQELEEHRQAIAAMDEELAEKNGMLAEMDEAIAEKDEAIAEKDEAIAEKDGMLAEWKREIEELRARNRELEERIAALA